MFILLTDSLQVVLTPEEKEKVDIVLTQTDSRFVQVKGQTVQTAFIRGIYDLEAYYGQEKASLAIKGKWRCMKCGSVLRYEDRCYCGQQTYNFLIIKTNVKAIENK